MVAADELVVVIGNDRLEAGGHSGVGAFTLPVAEWPKASAGGVREEGPALVGAGAEVERREAGARCAGLASERGS
jgi:hypothetical protein